MYTYHCTGVFGGMQLYGKTRDYMWSELSATAKKGATSIDVADMVGWNKNDEIVLSTTSYSAWETETFRITSITNSGKRLHLNATLQHTHLGEHLF